MMKIYDKKLAYPYFIWMVLFTVVPLIIVVYYAPDRWQRQFHHCQSDQRQRLRLRVCPAVCCWPLWLP